MVAWKLPGSRSPLPVSLILLLPLLAAPQQLLSSASSSSSTLDLAVDSSSPDHLKIEDSPPSSTDNTIIKRSTDVSALATLALGANAPAVRAPPVQISSRGNSINSPAPQLQARSLQDWEVEDFVLLATVDGTIYARDRKTGAPRWALTVPSSPMVETIYHRANQPSVADVQPEDDYLWIVEPTQDGVLYMYRPGPNGGLQRLGLTVKSLVDETPYSGIDPPVTYTARKETTLYTVDARTGSILRVFSSHGAIPTEQACRRVKDQSSLDDDLPGVDRDDECESSRTIILGRIEYTIAIQNTETGMPICTIKYSEWAPNNRDSDLQGQYYRTMDDRHIYSMHDGVIYGFDHSKVDGRRYTQKLPSPVARVFDIAKPAAHPDSDPTRLIMLTQPPSQADFESVGLEKRHGRVFVNCTEKHGWYAMSETTYPLVTGRARLAQCYEKDFLPNDQPLMSLNLAQQKTALVGVHPLVDNPSEMQHTLPSISGPPAESSNGTPLDRERAIEVSSRFSTSPAREQNSLVHRSLNSMVDLFATVILLGIATFVYFNGAAIRELAKQKLDLRHILVSGEPSMPTTPVLTSTTAAENMPRGLANATRPETPTPVVQVTTPETPVPPTANGHVTTSETAAESVPVKSGPRVTIQDAKVVDGDDDETKESPEKSPEKRKKARRGRRGGVTHRRGKKPPTESSEGHEEGNSAGDTTPKATQNQTMLAPNRSMLRANSSEFIEPDGALRVGQLKVYPRRVLGHGSHGTVVYKGSFDGRDVAVKRMLVEFYDVATHEVSLLQESDDHHNVIRYFCREQSAGFLYIALELCPASLQDIIERPDNFPQLIKADLAVPDILRQITAGVRYLHSLKIVHRDLKPQNILVVSSKSRTGGLRLLISDFGLCKKLEDNQSSFRATTAHAAGTSGWRAPELLVDDDQNPPTLGSQTDHSLDSSEPAVVDPQTNRRATRAIDIFSLGCVFYYVLTRGGHPFDKDGKFMREANIVKGNHNLDELQRLGDYAFEAEDLISQMLSRDPRKRPDATKVMMHPFFWPPTDRLSFLCDVSDHFEFEPRDPPSNALLCLESIAQSVMGPEMDFLKLLPRDFKDSLGKQRKYTGSKMLDLLRALRNKRNHYNDMPEHLKAHIGGLPVGYLQFWAVRFPSLLINCHWVVMVLGLADTERFRRYFTPPE